MQAQLDQASQAQPVSIGSGVVDAGELDGVKASATGAWVGEQTVFIDNRTHHGIAGFHVVTPVRIMGSDMHVLVLRGWVPRDPRDRTRLPAVPGAAGQITVVGIAQAHIAKTLELARSEPPGPGDRIWQNLDFQTFEHWSGLKLHHVLLRQLDPVDTDDTLVRQWPVATLDVDKHLGYAFQWFAMAVLIAVLFIYFQFVRRNERTQG